MTDSIDTTPDPQPPGTPAQPHVFEALAILMSKVTNVPKTGQAPAAAGGYKFRSVEHLTQVVGEACREVELILQTELWRPPEYHVERVGDKLWTSCRLVMRYRLTSLRDGSQFMFEAAGEGRDNSDKATAKAMSVALKYALGQSLLIGTGDEDPDAERPGDEPEKPAQAQQGASQSSADSAARAQMTGRAYKALEAARQPGLTREKMNAIWSTAHQEGLMAVVLTDPSGAIPLGDRLTAIANSLPPAHQPAADKAF